MLLSAPPPEDLFEKTCHFADSGAYSRETLVHPTRVIQFLVGVRGKNETMAIGGPWYCSLTLYPIYCLILLNGLLCRSPSLDGPDPEGSPLLQSTSCSRLYADDDEPYWMSMADLSYLLENHYLPTLFVFLEVIYRVFCPKYSR